MKRVIPSLLLVPVAAIVLASSSLNAKELVERVDGAFPFDAKRQTLEFESVASYSPTEVATYSAKKGERLKEVLKRWTKSVGYDLVWQPKPEDGDLQLAGSIEFHDTFMNATEEFFTVLREQSPFDAQVHPNRVLRVFLANSNQ